MAPVWADEEFRRAVTSTSPDLAYRVEAVLAGQSMDVRRARRAGLALARYAIRYGHRSTPFGLFAGVAVLEFGETAAVRVGDGHEIVTRPAPRAVAARIASCETDAARMAAVEVCVNPLAQVWGECVRVPAEGASEFSLAVTPAVAVVLEAAASPISHEALLGKLAAEFPDIPTERPVSLVAELLRVGLLRSALRAPATVIDPASIVPAGGDEPTGQDACDVRLDADVRLPEAVGVEVETAATVLARLTRHQQGTPAWCDYVERFSDRWGEGVEISLEQLIDPDRGLGLPAGFGSVSEPPRTMTRRDRLLLELAGSAALEGRREVQVTGAMIEELEAAAGSSPSRPAPHFEVCAQVQSRSREALQRGGFRLRVQTVSRAAGSMSGRFWHLLPEVAGYPADLPTVTPGAKPVQLSFHPCRSDADLLTRAPQVLPEVLSVGEFRGSDETVLRPADLVVGLSGGHLYLAVAATGQRIEPIAPTAINFVWNNYTPPIARFLAELSRARTPQVTWFDWGAAFTLPFTPALRYRRSILTTARWLLRPAALPDQQASTSRWADALHAWRKRAGVPERVLLAVDDQHLPLDLSREMDLDLLRTHLRTSTAAVLHDAPPEDANGWIEGRAHSIVVPVRSNR
ncbi:lantibiotic dehydratase family protein [Saccharopolyspora endophytica]|nr:lantibiotic dehydratase family protein [Saccharopolyspora endophytica]